MFRAFVIAAAFMPILVLGLTNPALCRNGAPLPSSILISGCPTAPCNFVPGTIVSTQIGFTAPFDLYAPLTRVFVESLGMYGEYELKREYADVCSNIEQTCPLSEGEDVTFHLQMDIYEDLPITNCVFEIVIQEAGTNLTCYRLPASIVPGE